MNDSLIEKFLSSAGRELIVLKYDGHNWYNRKQIAEVYGYKDPRNILRTLKQEDVHIITLCKDKLVYKNPVLGLRDVIEMLSGEKDSTPKTNVYAWRFKDLIPPKANVSVWVREDTLIKFSQRADLDKMDGDGQKILDILLANQASGNPVFNEEVLDD